MDHAWNWISGKASDIAGKISGIVTSVSRSDEFKKDEAAKWFGLFVTKRNPVIITRLIETSRLSNLMEESLHFHETSPKRQFPSVCSFVGFTGAGKSTLIRALIFHSQNARQFKHLEAPVSGAQSGDAAILSTTGEVNLYADPDTFGSVAPTFYADCEGMLGTEPDAVEHQREWANHAKRSHLVEAKTKDGKPMDRRSAVETLYPRFLYIFSNVICYITRDHKLWADAAVRLLEWSKVGAQSTINQNVLPALIIVLNAPTLENPSWISDDHDAVTRDFFRAIDKEISENAQVREMAQLHGDKSMKHVFARCFSSVYVHYIPLEGYKTLGTTEEIYRQTRRLAKRIRDDSDRVQALKSETMTRFDTKQMSMVVDYAFEHLAKGSKTAFDFSQCRVQTAISDSTEGNFSEFLGHCLNGVMSPKFDATANVLATCLLRRAFSGDPRSVVLHPSFIFSKDVQNLCKRAISNYLDNNAQCGFVDPDHGDRCANTKSGHALGHQTSSGMFLKSGLFQDTEFDQDRFLSTIQKTIHNNIRMLNTESQSAPKAWSQFAASQHARSIATLRQLGGYPSTFLREGLVCKENDIRATNMCYGCIFGRAEYKLPCSHVICVSCLGDFDDTTPAAKYPGRVSHSKCVICGDFQSPGWPYKSQTRPDLGGIRALSLDGGGVRGIVELEVLRRLEEKIGLSVPLGQFFDIMVGTSAGGIISLGLGIQTRSVSSCIKLFRKICSLGFEAKPLTKSSFVGWLARCVANSIYKTEPLESALISAFASDNAPNDQVFGLRNPCRVAVTTTVDDDGCLIANYNRGGTGRQKYLNSELKLWEAARCTSAAPMYFEPAKHRGFLCRDGGLKENNPVHIAVSEAKATWGENVDFDAIVSVGCGRAKQPQKKPSSFAIIPDWLGHLFTILISTMNGEDAWLRYCNGKDMHMLDRSTRLNVYFEGTHEPALDDVDSITSLQRAAERYVFHYRSSRLPAFSPLSGTVSTTMLDLLADRLRASMFFFHITSISKIDGVSVVQGMICCRLGPGDTGYQALLRRTKGFFIKSEFQNSKIDPRSHLELFRRHIVIQQQSVDEPIRIDVNFGSSHSATISGFPKTLKVGDPIRNPFLPGSVNDISKSLQEYWGVHFDTLSHNLVELDSTAVARDNQDGTQAEPAGHAEVTELPVRESAPRNPLATPIRNTVRLPQPSSVIISKTESDSKESKTVSTGDSDKSPAARLIEAAEKGNSAELTKLLNSGLHVDTKSAGWTALATAAKAGNTQIVKTLMSKGANLDIRMDVGWGLLPGDGSALNWAAQQGHLPIVKTLVQAGAKLDIDAKKPVFLGTGGTPIVMAAGADNLDVVRYLLEVGVDAQSPAGLPSRDAFMCACGKGSMAVIKHFVLVEGYSVTHQNGEGHTPMHSAALGEQKAAMTFLAQKGADINAKDHRGWTPLHHAAHERLLKSAIWLRINGAKLNEKNKDGQTPLVLAKLKVKDSDDEREKRILQCLDASQPIPEEDRCVLM